MDELVMDREVGDLQISLSWTSKASPRSAAEATWGRLRVSVRDQVVWHGDPASLGFEWSWIELLEHLGDVWRYLLLEDAAPLRVKIDTAPRMLAAAEVMIEDEGLAATTFEQDLVYGFQQTHDLAQAIQGALLPPLWIVRQGVHGWVCTTNWIGAVSFHELIDLLAELGDHIAARLVDLTDQRSLQARERWIGREGLERSDVIKAATGYPPELVAEVESAFFSEEERDWTEATSDVLLAAARSLGPLPATVLVPILNAVRQAPAVDSKKIDELTRSALEHLSKYQDGPPYEQGYALAEWLRALPDVTSPVGRVDPESLLKSWGVPIREEALGLSDLDAIGCWGPQHGPTIIINTDGAQFSSRAGQRITLAHEIAHLMVDRHRSLPLVEVLAGRSPEVAEVRARAFAAELLLPRELAAEVFFDAHDFDGALRTLRGRFRVSSEVVAWQVKNSTQHLDAAASKYLSSYVSQPSRFR